MTKFLTCQRLIVNTQKPTVVNKRQMTNDQSRRCLVPDSVTLIHGFVAYRKLEWKSDKK